MHAWNFVLLLFCLRPPVAVGILTWKRDRIRGILQIKSENARCPALTLPLLFPPLRPPLPLSWREAQKVPDTHWGPSVVDADYARQLLKADEVRIRRGGSATPRNSTFPDRSEDCPLVGCERRCISFAGGAGQPQNPKFHMRVLGPWLGE
ncbi:hypothetical protein BGZ63DRAFT_92611 [Mariannaea sp. PMI_226]|nr:hypothetical protein BGZ63DRAFT_92611 [Mariannaea sp. PMI_226]